MPGSTNITVYYDDSTSESFTNCTSVVENDAKLTFTGTLEGGSSAAHVIPFTHVKRYTKTVS